MILYSLYYTQDVVIAKQKRRGYGNGGGTAGKNGAALSTNRTSIQQCSKGEGENKGWGGGSSVQDKTFFPFKW